jgi:hypothetical protein
MEVIKFKYNKVADFCYELFRISEMPLHFSKFSNKIFSNYNHLFLLVYKQFRKFTYEELLTDLENNLSLRAYLGLDKLPHYTTLIKFAKRLPLKILDKLILSFRKLINKPKKVAIDATGITLDNASPHYCKRIGLPTKKRPFLKTTFVVDIEKYFILLVKQRKKTRHDVIDAEPLLKKLFQNYKDIEIFYADRGYDKEQIFKTCVDNNTHPMILQKNMLLPKHKKKGAHRKQFVDYFDYGEYLQRNKIETLNSMFKKRFSNNIKSSNNKMQQIELLTRVIAYNIDRLLRTTKKIILIFIKIIRVSY